MNSVIQIVVQMDAYLTELKNEATALAGQVGAVERGYFSAAEDDRLQALLASYTHARKALLDLIGDCRAMLLALDTDSEDYDREFLTAMAAACILIDAARFLREVTEGKLVVRRKLNQPLPQFGIEGGTYDRVQKSLVSATNAYHLLSALRYLRVSSQRLDGRATDDAEIASVLRIIRRLEGRLDVPLQRFAHVKLRTRSDQWIRSAGRRIVLRSVYSLQKMVSTMMSDVYVRSGHRPGLPPHVIDAVEQLIRPGDILVVRKEFALTNYFLPGYWPHAALCLGTQRDLSDMQIQQHANVAPRWNRLIAEEGVPRVLESLKDGVHIRSWHSPLASDSLLLLRPNLSAEQIARGIARTMAHEGKPYDFDFDFSRSDRLVCTEVAYRAFDGLDDYQLPLTYRAGRPTLSGGDLTQLACEGKWLQPVCCYAPRFANQLATESTAIASLIHQATTKTPVER